MRKNTRESFWARINRVRVGCWIWPGATKVVGYGKVRWSGVDVLAHRKAWELERGPIPRGKQVCHRCDNPLCVRPSHLFLGTFRQNMRDKVAKGRTRLAPHEVHRWRKVGKSWRAFTRHAPG